MTVNTDMKNTDNNHTQNNNTNTSGNETYLKRFGDLVEGDVIRAPDGSMTTVTEAYDQYIPKTMYEIEDNNGNTIKASGNHLWYIETDLDISLHAERRRAGSKLFKKLSKENFDELLKLAEFDGEEEIETTLIDVMCLINMDRDPEALKVIVRVAESIGPVSESNVIFQDYINTDDREIKATIRGYDAKRFGQQLLSLTGVRKYKKRWPLITGRVVTTEQMIELSENFEVNIPESKQNISLNNK